MVKQSKHAPVWILWLFAILTILLVPLIYSSRTSDISNVPQFLVSSLSIFLIAILLFIHNRSFGFIFKLTAINLGILFYVFFCFTSILLSGKGSMGSLEFLKAGSWAMMIIFIAELLKTEAAAGIFLKIFSFSAIILSLIGLGQLTGIAFTEIPGNVIPYGTMGNRNVFVPALLMILPFSAYHALSEKEKKWKFVALASSCLVITVIIASGMRTAWMALILGSFAAILILFFNKKDFQLEGIRIPKIAFMILIAAIAAGSVLFYSMQTQKGRIGLTSTNSVSERIEIWKNSWEMFVEHPVNGVGIGNWKIMMPQYGLEKCSGMAQRGEMHYQRAENDFIQVVSETGATGFIAYAFIFACVFFLTIIQMRRGNTREEKMKGLILFVALLFYSVIALLGFPKESSFLSAELAFLVAFLFFTNNPGPAKQIKIHSLWFILFFGTCSYAGIRSYQGELYIRRIIEARALNMHEKVVRNANEALKIGYRLDPAVSPVSFYRGVANYSMGRTDVAIKDFENAYEVHPNHIHVLNNLATCYAAKGENKKAIGLLYRALAISPKFKDASINLAAAQFNVGNTGTADSIISGMYDKSAMFKQVKQIIYQKVNDSLRKLAMEHYQEGNYEKAKKIAGKRRLLAGDSTFNELDKVLYDK